MYMGLFHKTIYAYRHHIMLGAIIIVVLTMLGTSIGNYVMFQFLPHEKTTTISSSTSHHLGDDEENAPRVSQQDNSASTVIFHGDRTKRQIALTFDADMTYGMQRNIKFGTVKSYYDDKLIAVLRKTHTKATLFLTGLWMETYPAITKDLAKDPLFELGNHSYSHPSFSGTCYGLPQVPQDELIEEVALPERMLREVTGKPNIFFRFPGGCFDTQGINIAKLAGDQVIQWDVVGGDGFNANGQQITHNVVDHVQNGSIIVMHMNGIPNEPETAIVMPTIIAELRAKGFEFVTVSELLGK